MKRRNFLKGMIAAATAPAFVRYGSLMVPAPLKDTFLSYYEQTITIDQMRTGRQILQRQDLAAKMYSEALHNELDPIRQRWVFLLNQTVGDGNYKIKDS